MINKYYILFVFNVLFAVGAQILLKTSANKKYDNMVKEYLNPLVVSAYCIFVLNTLISIYCYKFLELKQGGVLQMFSYIFVLILDRLIFKQRITSKRLIGMLLILSGIFVFYL